MRLLMSREEQRMAREEAYNGTRNYFEYYKYIDNNITRGLEILKQKLSDKIVS